MMGNTCAIRITASAGTFIRRHFPLTGHYPLSFIAMLLCQTFVHCTIFSTAVPFIESLPFFSKDVAGHTFISATDRRLGLYQLANPASILPNRVENRCITHPFAFRLACVGPHR